MTWAALTPSFLGSGRFICTRFSNVNAVHRKLFARGNSSQGKFDVVVVGGGIVGVASALELLLRHPHLKLAIVEKEAHLAAHQSSHNSGVIHAGIYYAPGSLKAKLCVEGLDLAYQYLDKHQIPYKKCGKLIVALDHTEIPLLDNLYNRALKNKCKDIAIVERTKIRDYEPHCRGLKAIWSPHTGIVDWKLVTQHYGEDFKKRGGTIFHNFEVKDFHVVHESSGNDKEGNKYPICVSADEKSVMTRYVLTCGGLQSDRLAQMSGCDVNPRIIPFRGEYLLLKPEKSHLVKGNIYPVPDPRFPFLGVHFTPRMDGSVWLGPNAILAFSREGYRWNDIKLSDFLEAVSHRGFQRLALRYTMHGAKEIARSIFPSLQISRLQKFIPEITIDDIQRGPAGVRAQAMDLDGNLVEDFVFDIGEGELGKRVLHCRNAPSPGATSSLAIAKMIADKVNMEFHL